VSACPICDRGEPLDVITELESVWITAAATAPLPGYVCVVANRHAEESYELPRELRLLFWEEAMGVAEAVAGDRRETLRERRLARSSRSENYDAHAQQFCSATVSVAPHRRPCPGTPACRHLVPFVQDRMSGDS
jgi:hypothetical protein